MPSVSKKQHNLMAMVANDPAAAKRMGIPQSVGEEFMKADKGRKFGSGSRPDRQGINKPKTDHGKSALFAKGGEMAESKKMMGKEVAFMKKKGAPKSMLKHEMAEMKGKKMAVGGGVSSMPARNTSGISNLPTRNTSGISSMPSRTGEYTGGFGKPGGFSTGVKNKLPPGSRPGAGNRPGNLGLGAGGPNIGPGGMRKGGLAAGHKQADGIAKKGKTKAATVKMSGSKPLGMKKGGCY